MQVHMQLDARCLFSGWKINKAKLLLSWTQARAIPCPGPSLWAGSTGPASGSWAFSTWRPGFLGYASVVPGPHDRKIFVYMDICVLFWEEKP